MTYRGYEELKSYIQHTKKPSFKEFVEGNVANLANWSYEGTVQSSAALNGCWFEKYCQVFLEVYGRTKVPRKASAYNVLLWNDILTRMNARRNMVDKCREAALDVIGHEASSAAAQVVGLSVATSSTREDDQDDEGARSADDVDTVGSGEQSLDLKAYAAKKFLGTLDEQDKAHILQKRSYDTTISGMITNYVIRLICQDQLTSTEQETLKLLLSKIVNTLDTSIYAELENIFTKAQLDNILHLDTPEYEQKFGLDQSTIALLDDIIEDCDTVAKFLRRVSLEKVELIEKNDWHTDRYRMLCILGAVGDSFTMPIDPKASELTFYRRFAVLLDYVYGGTEISMTDGELVAEATKMAMEQNYYDTSNLFGRKIDLLLKMKDSSTELASNEWKSHKSSHLRQRQQSRNIRSNCAILNKLYIESYSLINTTMAMDVVGTTGYIYKLQWKGSVYVTKLVERIFLASNMNELGFFKATIKALFFWKDFLLDLGHVMQRTYLQNRLNLIAASASTSTTASATHTSSPPPIFFTPKNKRVCKRQIHAIDWSSQPFTFLYQFTLLPSQV